MIKLLNKYAFYLAGVLLGCASCEKNNSINEEGQEGCYIQFTTPTLAVETRSHAKDYFEDGDAFGVLGYCVPYTVGTSTPNYGSGGASWSNKKKQCPPDVFYKQKVLINANGCIYDYTGGNGNNPKYWYRDGYDTKGGSNPDITNTSGYNYSFIAYYPYEGAFTIEEPVNESTAGAPVLTFIMPQEGNSLDTPLDHNKTPDAMLSVLYNRLQSDGNLNFNFSHVLTGLGFEVNNFSNYDLRVHSIFLKGAFYKTVKVDLRGDKVVYSFPNDRYVGTYTIFNAETMGGDLVLSAPAEGETVTSSPSPVGPIRDELEGRNEHLLLISGTGYSFGEDVEVYIKYTFNGESKEQHYSRPSTFTPRPGVKYTAQLNFVGDAFVLQFVTDNDEQWGNGMADDGNEENDDIIFE